MDPIDPWKWIGHITASYIIAAVVLAAFVAWLIYDGRRQQAEVDGYEARGIKRRQGRK